MVTTVAMIETPKSKTREYIQEYNRMYYSKKKKDAESRNTKLNWQDYEARKEYFRDYQRKNKERYDIINKTEYQCPVCLKTITKQSSSNHNRSQFHLNALTIRNLAK